MDNGKIIAEQTDFTLAVHGEQDGLLIVSAVSDQLNDVSGGDHVEPNCGFVKNDDIRVVDNCTDNGYFCLIPDKSSPIRRSANS